MKNLIIKLKRTDKKYRVIFYSIFILYFISVILISKSLLLLTGIETFIRYVFIITFFILAFLYAISNMVFLIIKKHRWIIVTGIITILFSLINIAGYYYINKTYNYIDNINKNMILYKTSLVSLKTTDKVVNVGMISNENDIEGYILPKEYLEKKGKYEVEFYNEYYDLLNALYDGSIDAVFISGNYTIIYSSLLGFENIKNETKVIDSFSKKLSKKELN